jgi:hypothetical protein
VQEPELDLEQVLECLGSLSDYSVPEEQLPKELLALLKKFLLH